MPDRDRARLGVRGRAQQGGTTVTGYRQRARFLLIMVGELLLAPLISGAQQPRSGGTRRVAWEADVAGRDPHLSPGAQAGYVMGNTFNSLVTIDAELTHVPDLADSRAIVEDGKVYVFPRSGRLP
jgi:ABC-type oligopeptide transport system substrate-binding subunit